MTDHVQGFWIRICFCPLSLSWYVFTACHALLLKDVSACLPELHGPTACAGVFALPVIVVDMSL
jgi:hypothetical protein